MLLAREHAGAYPDLLAVLDRHASRIQLTIAETEQVASDLGAGTLATEEVLTLAEAHLQRCGAGGEAADSASLTGSEPRPLPEQPPARPHDCRAGRGRSVPCSVASSCASRPVRGSTRRVALALHPARPARVPTRELIDEARAAFARAGTTRDLLALDALLADEDRSAALGR